MFFVLSRAWDKEKFLSPQEESNLKPPSNIYYEVHVTRVLHTAGISIETVEAQSPQERYIDCIHVRGPSVHILQG